MGNEYLFQIMAQQNIEVLNTYNIKTIVTTCPHCFNTMRNEYPQFGGNYEVLHYSQFVDGLIREGRIKPIKVMDVSVAYHDSCFLGRHNGVYDEPRNVANAIPGLTLVEMSPRCRERGFCCGAGGGHMWIEESQGERINHVRTDHFLETGADTVAVSCPFCPPDADRGYPGQRSGRCQRSPGRDRDSGRQPRRRLTRRRQVTPCLIRYCQPSCWDYMEQRLLFRPRPLVDATPNDLGLEFDPSIANTADGRSWSAGTFQGNLKPT